MKDTAKRGQRYFWRPLIEALLNTSYPQAEKLAQGPYKSKSISRLNMNALNHRWGPFKARAYCVWCQRDGQKNTTRSALTDITNQAISSSSKRRNRSYGGCIACSVCLCLKGACFKQYHSQQ